MSRSLRLSGTALLALGGLALGSLARADIVDVRQGTNIAVAVDPGGSSLIVDLLGGLWRLPVSGGGATMLSPPGSGIAHPRFSPNGEHIVVERHHDGQWDLWIYESASGDWRQLTDTPQSERHPDFYDDGAAVVFASDRSGRFQLWTLDLATAALRQLTDEPGNNDFPATATDGSVAYVNRLGRRYSLRVTSTGPTGDAIDFRDAPITAPSWRPESPGPVVVFNTQRGDASDLEFFVDADIEIARTLTQDEDVFPGRVAWLGAAEFIYAADGQLWRRTIASSERRPVHMFASVSTDRAMPEVVPLPAGGAATPVRGIRDIRGEDARSGLLFAALGDIWRVRGRNLDRLTDDPSVDVEPTWLADTDDILFLSDRGGSFDVWRLSSGSSVPAQVTSLGEDVFSLVVSSDGQTLYFLSSALNDAQRTTLMRAPASGGNATAIAGPFTGRVTLTAPNGVLTLAGNDVDPDTAVRLSDTVRNLESTRVPAEPQTIEDLPEMRWSAAVGAPMVIQVGRLFDGIGNTYRRHVDIHVDGGRIVEIVGRDRLPATGTIVDLSEATALPGLIDVHVHHPDNTGIDVGDAWLRAGVTTVREVSGNLPAALERAEAWASGRRPGPRLIVAARAQRDATAGWPLARSPVSGGFGHARLAEPLTVATPIVSDGTTVALSPRLDTYQDTLAMLDGSGSWLATGVVAGLASLGARESAARAQRLGAIVERAQRSFGRVAIGSDAPAVPFGTGFIAELEALERAGVPPAQILRWATAGGAMALGLDRELGTVEAGKRADLVIVDGDPLASIGEIRRVELVVRNGLSVAPFAAGNQTTADAR